jgi:hypothetical protein
VKRTHWVAVLIILLCALRAGAAEFVFHNITWNRHDTETGFREWVLFAKRAEPRPNDAYACLNLELQTYKLLADETGTHVRKEMNLKADRGVYRHGTDKSVTDLDGNVKMELSEREPVKVTTDKAKVVSTWDKKKKVRGRTMTTRSPIRIVSDTRVLTGTGANIYEQSGQGTQEAVQSRVKILRDVKMVIPGKLRGDPFAALPAGKAAAPESATPSPMIITAQGPLFFDRLANRALFENDVVVVRAGTRMTCRKLTLTFASRGPSETPKEGEEKDPRLKHMLAEHNVIIRNREQTFYGDTFDWDPKAQVGKLAGKPARMVTEDMDGRADTIEFEQKTGLVRYIGRSEVTIQLKPE